MHAEDKEAFEVEYFWVQKRPRPLLKRYTTSCTGGKVSLGLWHCTSQHAQSIDRASTNWIKGCDKHIQPHVEFETVYQQWTLRCNAVQPLHRSCLFSTAWRLLPALASKTKRGFLRHTSAGRASRSTACRAPRLFSSRPCNTGRPCTSTAVPHLPGKMS